MKFRAAVGSMLVGGVLAGAAVMPAASSAGEVGIMAQPGDLCWIDMAYPNAGVWADETLTTWSYSIPGGHAFRVLGYAGANMTVPLYYGRGNGKPNGYLPRMYINQATCTQ